ncbi:MAG: cupin domain-containing protein [Pseudothermotoga sp.]
MIYKVSDVPNLINDKIDARRFYDSDKATVAKITIQSGEKLEKHSSKEFALLFVISGKVAVQIGDNTCEMEKDSLVEFPENIPHSVENLQSIPAEVLVIKIK